VTDNSAGTTFMTYDISYPTPIGPLAAGTTYDINFSSSSANGYFLQMSSRADSHTGTLEDLCLRGAAYTNSTDMGKDVRFVSNRWQVALPTSTNAVSFFYRLIQ